MKKGPFKLHQIIGAILLVAIVATGGFGSAAANHSDVPVVAPERQANLEGLPTNQIIIKYRTNVNTTNSKVMGRSLQLK